MSTDSDEEISWSELTPASQSLFRICTAMGSTLELGELLDLILTLTMEQLNAQQGSILLFDRESDQLRMLASRGMPAEITERGYVPRKGSIAEWVIEHDTPLLLDDVSRETRFTTIAAERDIHCSMCVPLRAKGKVIGTINITRTRRERFTQADLDTLVILAAQAAVSIENARLYEENMRATRLATVGETVAGISHCIKNMLTGLKGGAFVLEMGRKQKNWDLVDQGWDVVKRNTDRISLLVLDMLDYSKERVPVRSSFDILRLIEDVCAGVAYAAKQANVELQSRLGPGCETLFADYQQIYRALLNLATNAIEAISAMGDTGGTVEISVERAAGDSPQVSEHIREAEGDYILFNVRDTGEGISPEHLSEIFQPFFSSKGSRGTGLGLAVTRKVAREHGGDVAVRSNPGEGTVFTVILPVVDAPREQSGEAPAKRVDSSRETGESA